MFSYFFFIITMICSKVWVISRSSFLASTYFLITSVLMLPEGDKLTKKINVHNHANKKDVQIAYHIQVVVDWKAMKTVGRETIHGLNTNKIVIITLMLYECMSRFHQEIHSENCSFPSSICRCVYTKPGNCSSRPR